MCFIMLFSLFLRGLRRINNLPRNPHSHFSFSLFFLFPFLPHIIHFPLLPTWSYGMLITVTVAYTVAYTRRVKPAFLPTTEYESSAFFARNPIALFP